MKSFCMILVLFFTGAVCHSQIFTVDSLFVHGRQHNDLGMRLLSPGNKTQALNELDTATDMLRDYQDGLQDGTNRTTDSIIHIFEALQQNEPQSPVYYYLIGRVLGSTKADSVQIKIADTDLNKAIKLEPQYPWPYYALAYPFVSRKDYLPAIELYNKAVAVDSSFVLGYDALIKAYHELGMTEDSLRCENILMHRFLNSFSTYFRRVNYARRENNVDTKIKILRQIITTTQDPEIKTAAYTELLAGIGETRPDSVDSIARQVLNLQGVEYLKSKQFAYQILFGRAKKKNISAIQAIAADIYRTNDPFLNNMVGKYYRDSLKMNDQALKFIQRAYLLCTKEYAYNTLIIGNFTDQKLQETTDNFQVWVAYGLGLTYIKLGENDKAEEYLMHAAIGSNTEKVVDAYYQLGALYVNRGQKDNAIRWLAKGLSIQANEEAREQLVALEGSEEKAQHLVEETRKTNERPASNFKLYSIDGDSVELSSLRGKIVVVDFWATWCHPCVMEMPFLQKVLEQYTKKTDVSFISISMDRSRDTVRPFIKKNGYGMKVLYDDGTSLDYGVEGIPSLIIIDRRGKIQFKHVGFDGDGVKFDKMLRSEIEELLSQN